MKTTIYNSQLAKLLLFKGYPTIMFFGFILTKLKELTATSLRHERTHQRQYIECMEIAAIPALVLAIYVTPWWFLLVPTFYYLLYLGEWLVSFVYHLFKDWSKGLAEINHMAYISVSFEREAKMNQCCRCYLKERKWGAWFGYYGKGCKTILLKYGF